MAPTTQPVNGSAFDAVVFDYYGTLAEHDGGGISIAAVLAARGYDLPSDVARRYWQDGLDGTEHDEPSRSRDHYVAWQDRQFRALLGECGVPAAERDEIVEQVRAPGARGRMIPYSDAAAVLQALRSAGVRTAICSNWDWDLRESLAQTELDALVDLVVSSAWIGARKPHRRIYDHTLAELGVEPERTLFVGDTWNCDVTGPLALGMAVAYVRRPHREPDHTEIDAHTVAHHRAPDLSVVLTLVGLAPEPARAP